MAGTKTAKLFTHGRSQAVRLSKEFRLPGTEVRVSRFGNRVILEPIARDPAAVAAVFAEIDRLLEGAPFPDVRTADDPPVAPDRRVSFEEWSVSTRVPSSPCSTTARRVCGVG
jgi:antitoxin VapB